LYKEKLILKTSFKEKICSDRLFLLDSIEAWGRGSPVQVFQKSSGLKSKICDLGSEALLVREFETHVQKTFSKR